MKLIVTDAAVNCFREEWDYREEDNVRIYVRYSGGGSYTQALRLYPRTGSGYYEGILYQKLRFFIEAEFLALFARFI
ncbi:hypothetical protein [Paenibacillus pinihumi]|uniref:hypothetical protein n=1 Tax=Paenibacillus pinihumi TaxID=669462 RepID=UPI0003F647EE|nr:hypothetical protein [Paenibacillus pinihumi]